MALDPVDEHVGARLRLRRLMLGLSQEYLAEVLGVTFQQIQKYERGANRISASRLHDLSEVLDVPPSFFFDGLNDARTRPPEGEARVNDLEATTLARLFEGIPDRAARRSIFRMVEALGRPSPEGATSLAGERVATAAAKATPNPGVRVRPRRP